jgi:predicted nucleic-acid-binding Zn-ribbon protein
MPNYKIIGADLMEYGPVSAEQIRQWIAEGRVNAETKLQAEGGGEWKRLAEVPEFAEAPPAAASPTCPKCGEPFEDGLDECWKCGTRKDGSRPKEWTPVDDAKQVAEQCEPCPKCGSDNVSRGKLLPVGRGTSVMFEPEGTRFFSGSFSGGVDVSSDRWSSFACLDCGLVWDYLRPDELKEFISKHCKEDAYALLSEGVRLESKGDTAGALAKYEAVLEKFPGTGAAGDAEVSIRNLRDASG